MRINAVNFNYNASENVKKQNLKFGLNVKANPELIHFAYKDGYNYALKTGRNAKEFGQQNALMFKMALEAFVGKVLGMEPKNLEIKMHLSPAARYFMNVFQDDGTRFKDVTDKMPIWMGFEHPKANNGSHVIMEAGIPHSDIEFKSYVTKLVDEYKKIMGE